MNDRTSVVSLTQSSSSLSSTWSDHSFEQRIKERDEICVLTDEIETFCVAAHVIPHAKGSPVCPYLSYISPFTSFLTLFIPQSIFKVSQIIMGVYTILLKELTTSMTYAMGFWLTVTFIGSLEEMEQHF